MKSLHFTIGRFTGKQNTLPQNGINKRFTIFKECLNKYGIYMSEDLYTEIPFPTSLKILNFDNKILF